MAPAVFLSTTTTTNLTLNITITVVLLPVNTRYVTMPNYIWLISIVIVLHKTDQ
jgi:hypothetical protein